MIQDEKVLALITARGGSKGVPRKNVAPLCGQPLIAWTVQAALGSAHVDRVVLSSDDEEIIATAREWGCDVPFVRPAPLAADDTPGIAPVLHALDEVGEGFDWVVLLQPTSPLRAAADVDACIEAAASAGAPACVSVTLVPESPWWMFTLGDDGRMTPLLDGDAEVTRRQDSPPVYALNGAVYAARIGWLREHERFVTAETVAYVMPPERSVDIDTSADLAFARVLAGDEEGV